jgi:hypothetical protein
LELYFIFLPSDFILSKSNRSFRKVGKFGWERGEHVIDFFIIIVESNIHIFMKEYELFESFSKFLISVPSLVLISVNL